MNLRTQIIDNLAAHIRQTPPDQLNQPLLTVVLRAINDVDGASPPREARHVVAEHITKNGKVHPLDNALAKPDIVGRISDAKRRALKTKIQRIIIANPWCSIAVIRAKLAADKQLPARNLLRTLLTEMRNDGLLRIDTQLGVKRLRYASRSVRGRAPASVAVPAGAFN
jgi:hypothetical protein